MVDDKDKLKSAKEKISSTLEQIKQSDKVKEISSFAKENTADTIAYVILALGILISLFSPLYGGAIIGAIVGIYFADDIVSTLGNLKDFIKKKGKLKSFILLALFLIILMAAPALVIVAAAAIGIKQLVSPSTH